jgi:molybdate transport system substrate-binding protein
MKRNALAAFAATLVALAAGSTLAEEIHLLSAASMQTVFKEILGEFERSSGHKVVVGYGTMGAITGRVAGGEQADLVISSQASISSLVAQGRIAAGSELLIARTGVGAVVPGGDRKPRIESADDFKRALLESKVIVYANPAGGDVAEVTVARGPGALGLTQVSEIVGKPGMQFVPLPEDLQNYTGFVAGIPAGARPSEAVAALLAFLRTPGAAAVMKAKGMKID